MKNVKARDIDKILPQTQCGLCTYEGCMPYADALANDKAEINLCPPGGVDGLLKLGKLLNKNPSIYIEEMQQKAKPNLRAEIIEEDCIGCKKCIKACPVDAIIGGPKLMHSVITDECAGCELCIEPCPVDCIVMVESDDNTDRKEQYRDRYNAREKRLSSMERKASLKPIQHKTKENKQDYIKAALLRAKSR